MNAWGVVALAVFLIGVATVLAIANIRLLDEQEDLWALVSDLQQKINELDG